MPNTRLKRFFGQVFLLCMLVACQNRAPQPGQAMNEGWVSSGGEILRDTQNPWWIRNTKEVGYCILVDNATISASTPTIHTLVKTAIEYWKNEFNRSESFFRPPHRNFGGSNNGSVIVVSEDYPINPLGIATQDFFEVPCEQAKLKFQFGQGTLAVAQIDFLKSSRYIGAAIRTHYDPEQLVGQGVVVIASDRGSHSFTNSSLKPLIDPWLNSEWLLSVLVHELGHVFGITHTGERFSLMSERFPENLIFNSSDSQNRPAAEPIELPTFFRTGLPSGQWGSYPNLNELSAYLELPAPLSQTGVKIECEKNLRKIRLNAVDDDGHNPLFLGEINLGALEYQIHPVVTFDLPTEQKVFAANDIESKMDFIYGAYVIDSAVSQEFITTPQGKMKPIQIRFSGPGLWHIDLRGHSARGLIPLLGSSFFLNH